MESTLYAANGKRRVLIVEDEAINREILGAVLEKDYELVFAVDGEEALIKTEENKDFLSLILLDLIMPKVSGREVLQKIRENSDYQDIPVIVASADQSQEIDCLLNGASDFIQKPYPESGVILARVRRAIELFESRRIIQSTERDPLTGLYNREFFCSYAEQYDHRHPDAEMDAVVLDINRFETINERYGKSYGDEVLRCVAKFARDIVHESGGIICRKEADIFHIYCPHREDYKTFFDTLTSRLNEEEEMGNRVRLRMGVYSIVDKTLDIERRFARAKMAADTVRGSYTRSVGVYDDALHKAELYSEQLIEDFPKAIEQKQFKVYYQPKYDIRMETPFLSNAEGLVRWQHPDLGMISPGIFIPLFEQNGLIETLDHYVWREAARQMREWKEEIGFSVPVSVNVSRVDLNDPDLLYTLLGIVDEFHLSAEELHLEITESAYAEDTEKIIETVKRLRAVGFLVEMDDFGTGYSSLNMLSSLPIDVLKLDMKFIQTAFSGEQDVHMMKVIIEIAKHLSAPVVAEGVETEEQLKALKEIGCDLVQGYYFSPPVPAEKFGVMLEKAKAEKQLEAKPNEKGKEDVEKQEKKESFLRRWSKRRNISMRKASIIFVAAALLLIAALFVADFFELQCNRRMEEVNAEYILAEEATKNMEFGSDYLTDMVRSFVVTGDVEYLQNYFEEADVTRRRDHAVEDLQSLMNSKESDAYDHLASALSWSNELMIREYEAMNLILSTGDYSAAQIPEVLKGAPLSPEEAALSPAEKYVLAIDLVFGDAYMDYKAKIRENTSLCTRDILTDAETHQLETSKAMSAFLTLQTILIIVLFLVICIIVLFMDNWIRVPLIRMVKHMRDKETIPPSGAQELVFVSETYNAVFEENQRTHERLTYGNLHDPLTGLFNRGAYDFMRHDIDMSHNALVMIDVDKFRFINDNYGKDVGDEVLKRVAEVLKYCFRATDLLFRLEGDGFAAIVPNVNGSMAEMVKSIIEQVNVMLQKPADDLPPVSVSAGVAFADRTDPDGDIFKDADTALRKMKQEGSCGCCIY